MQLPCLALLRPDCGAETAFTLLSLCAPLPLPHGMLRRVQMGPPRARLPTHRPAAMQPALIQWWFPWHLLLLPVTRTLRLAWSTHWA